MIRLVRILAFAAALSAGHRADAAVYFLVQNATATMATPPRAVAIETGSTGAPASIITPQVVVTGGAACTAQVVGSNDGINWENVGSAIVVPAGSGHGGLASPGALVSSWNYWGATITTFSGGTSPACSVTASG